MRIGVPTEVKSNEYRVSVTPAGAAALIQDGHEVLIQKGAGEGSAYPDSLYEEVGAKIIDDADQVWASADMVMKVKEPIEEEYHRLRDGLILFTYLHLAADKACTDAIIKAGTTAIAYETVRTDAGTLPLLVPMSEVAGRLAAQVGAHYLEKPHGGPGVLMGSVAGVRNANVVVVGCGQAGRNAAEIAIGMGANVTVLDNDLEKLRWANWQWGNRARTTYSTPLSVEEAVADADLVIGSVLIPGAKAPKLVTDAMVAKMRPGSVLVDIAIDQGGCFEGSHPTTHDDPIFTVHDATYYCVANMPGCVPHTSTTALANATLPYARAIAKKGWKQALKDDATLRRGLNAHAGKISYPGVAEAFDLECVDPEELLEN